MTRREFQSLSICAFVSACKSQASTKETVTPRVQHSVDVILKEGRTWESVDRILAARGGTVRTRMRLLSQYALPDGTDADEVARLARSLDDVQAASPTIAGSVPVPRSAPGGDARK